MDVLYTYWQSEKMCDKLNCSHRNKLLFFTIEYHFYKNLLIIYFFLSNQYANAGSNK